MPGETEQLETALRLIWPRLGTADNDAVAAGPQGPGACGCRVPGQVMRPARTRTEGRRAGLVAAAGWSRRRAGECGRRRVLTDESVWAVCVVVREVVLQHYREVARSGDQEVVEALAAQGADSALGDRVGSRCPDRGADDVDVGAGEQRVEGGGELAVPVSDRKPKPAGLVAERGAP